MMSILVTIVIVLGIIVFAQMVRVLELTSILKNDKQNEISEKQNKTQAINLFIFMLAFFAFFIWLVVDYSHLLLPESASKHGEDIDWLMNFNLIIIIIAFVITHILLFFFALKYRGRKNGKADFVTHNHKLELVWTTVPAVVLAIIIIYGISTWNEITRNEPEDPLIIELYAKQFDWTARYAGNDGQLGEAHYRLISGTNPLGLITTKTINEKLAELESKKQELEEKKAQAIPGGKIEADLDDEIIRAQKHIDIVKNFQLQAETTGIPYDKGNDDKLVKVEYHIPVNKPVKFIIRSQDVIHSAFMPHFRAQMNAVPGMITTFYFTPTKTTQEMKQITENPDFNYMLLCNKICGSAHYNMKMDIIVDSEEDFEKWLNEQPVFYQESVETTSQETNQTTLAQN